MDDYKKFVEKKSKPERFQFQKNVVEPILRVIEKNQEYLTQPENLPQLAKLGFLFNTFWYTGRLCYGSTGVVSKGYDCEDNPKYELEDTIKYKSDEIENLIYDAWGMHVSNDAYCPTFDQFLKKLSGRQLTKFDLLEIKPNKTFDEWVELMTHKDYKYRSLFSDRRSVADYLLCTIGTGYGYKNGYIIKEASGADQDEAGYGDWENAKFAPFIQTVVDKVLSYPELKEAFDKAHDWYEDYVAKDPYMKRKRQMEEEMEKDPDFFAKLMGKHFGKETKREYYPICNYSNITKFDKKTHPSYIKAGIEICEDILANPPKDKPGYNEYQKEETKYQVKFAKSFLERFKK